MENNEKEIMTTEDDMDKNNNEDRRFYIYEHIRKDNNTCFYVGKGTGDRAYDLDRGNFHNGVCKEYGCRVKIIKDGLTEKEAFALERERIEDYVITFGYGAPIDGYRDYSNNYLTNFTWGGEGVSGMHHTEEVKQKIGEKMSETRKGKNNPMYGKHHSEESKRKNSEAHKGKPAPNRIKVKCTTTGETFDSMKEACDHYNVAQSSISECCNKKRKSAGKLNGIRLQWMYLEDDDNDLKAV